MNRRNTILRLIALLLAPPLGSHVAIAQQAGRVWRVGFLSFRTRPPSLETDLYGGFLKGMRELGYVEGRNLVIEWRFAEGNTETLSRMAAELVRAKVDLVVAAGDVATGAAKKASLKIPIVIGASADPVGNGLIASLSRPGGNITGLTNIARELLPKQLELLLGVIPKGVTVAVLIDPQSLGYAAFMTSTRSAAQLLNVKVSSKEAHTIAEINTAFAAMKRERVAAVIVTLAPLFAQQGRLIGALAAQNKLPSISSSREFPESGGFMSYGQNQTESYRRAATFVDKILKGAHPGELPVEQPSKFDMVINSKVAKAIGLVIPQELLLRADEVL